MKKHSKQLTSNKNKQTTSMKYGSQVRYPKNIDRFIIILHNQIVIWLLYIFRPHPYGKTCGKCSRVCHMSSVQKHLPSLYTTCFIEVPYCG